MECLRLYVVTKLHAKNLKNLQRSGNYTHLYGQNKIEGCGALPSLPEADREERGHALIMRACAKS
jgi:hypothetical protein